MIVASRPNAQWQYNFPKTFLLHTKLIIAGIEIVEMETTGTVGGCLHDWDFFAFQNDLRPDNCCP